MSLRWPAAREDCYTLILIQTPTLTLSHSLSLTHSLYVSPSISPSISLLFLLSHSPSLSDLLVLAVTFLKKISIFDEVLYCTVLYCTSLYAYRVTAATPWDAVHAGNVSMLFLIYQSSHWFPFLHLYSFPAFLTLSPELITPLTAPPVLLPHRPEQRCSERHGHNRKDFPVHSQLLHRTSHHLPPIPLQPLL